MKENTCSTGKRRFSDSRAAYRRLDQIQQGPRDSINALYTPVGVVSCPKCGGFHLTSKIGKRWRSGKSARNLRVPRRY
jgi:hypothetical protein